MISKETALLVQFTTALESIENILKLNITQGARVLLIWMELNCDENREITMSAEAMAKEIAMSRRSCQRIVKLLKDKNYIEIKNNINLVGMMATNTYTIKTFD